MLKKLITSLLVVGTVVSTTVPAIPAYAGYLSSSQYLGQTVNSNGKYDGWYRFSDGSYGYYTEYGKLVKNVLIKLTDGSYGFDENGKMITGWFPNGIDDNWYYFRNDGKAQTGWLNSDNLWYYFDNEGAMLTDWQYINNKWYYFDTTTGVMAANIKVGEYYLSADGSLQ